MPQKAPKKENLPVKVDVDLQNGGTISYANEVIATIAGVAANEIDGIAGMCVSGGIGEMLTRSRNITKGVKVEVGSQEAAVDVYVIVDYGKPIQKVAAEVQENVRRALESLTGLHVVRVDVHVQGVSFEKEKKANQNSLEASQNPVLSAPEAEAPAPKAKKAEEEKRPAQPEPDPEPVQEPAQDPVPTEADDVKTDDALADQDAFDEVTLKEEAQVDGETAPTAEPEAKEAPSEAPAAPEEKPAETKPRPTRKPRGRMRA